MRDSVNRYLPSVTTRPRLSRAFTLIELLIVITIIAVLASIAYPVFTGVQERARATQDMSNLRQIGLATQIYLNDNDSVLFPDGKWASLLRPKYLPAWKIFQSPFDKRSPSETTPPIPISYGFNPSAFRLTTDRITNPVALIFFSPAQASGADVRFGGTPEVEVTVDKADSNPGGPAIGGTHSGRKRINALMADLHVENMAWNDFKSATPPERWNPLATPTPAP